MDLDTLRFANFASVTEAVTDWGLLVRNLEDLRKQAEQGLHRAANQADWAGINAQVTKEFIGKTAGEFADAHTQAKTIHSILGDTVGELKQYREDLDAAIERGLKKNLTVMDTGHGSFTVSMNIHPDRAAQGTTVPEHDESDVTALRDEVQGILRKATESDNSARTVLKAIADRAALGFTDAAYKDRDAAAAAVKEADELAELAKQDPQDLTVAEFDRLNAGLKKYHSDPLFAERFASDLGPKKTLEFWAGVADPQVTPDLTRERLKQLGSLQKNLSLTLAEASQSDSPAMARWKSGVIQLGDQPVGHRPDVLGVQVMSNLMRAGDYDDAFMTEYGKKLMATERKFTDGGEHTSWRPTGFSPFLNRMNGDTGWDPLSGYLKGLSNSPEAATEFFNDDFLPKGGDHKHAVSNFTYLFEDRHWPESIKNDFSGDMSNDGRNNLASALEAATTGHPAGEMPTLDTPAHSAAQAKLFNAIVSSVGDEPERLTGHDYMSDSMGQIASEYLPDINRAAADVSRDSEDWDKIEKLYPIAGTDARVDHRDVNKFLFAVGQNPSGYAAVEVGQEAYMSKLMAYHLDPDLPADQRFSQDQETTVRYISERSGEVSGVLGLGRQEELANPAGEKDKAFEYSISQRKNWISGGVGTVVGVGTSFVATPWVGAAAGGVAGTATSVVLERVFKDAEGSSLDEIANTRGERWEAAMTRNNEYVAAGAHAAADRHHLSNSDDIARWARDGARQGFLNSGPLLNGQAPGSITTSS
ncbi:hypothetical protein IF655_18650 [Streptomyces sp. DSM 110735]|uniref:hypothetical protein n=1 Tax=Streptomyces sp. DSM 110735 TaxID=2775031 RepID=UPI0018F5AC9B|nr:hypothetical protein [Streptomyces sp. DSM 110735]MBJ7905309.1 hypothetical protein [Streptomyces sp. DSM 110735]